MQAVKKECEGLRQSGKYRGCGGNMEEQEERRNKMEKRQEKQAVLVSACLLGMECRYDGGNNAVSGMEQLKERAFLIPFCPELYGGLSTPREPSEIRDGKVWSKSGKDVTAQFEKGAKEAAKAAKLSGCVAAVLKQRSPSCGSSQIYDGTFQGRRIEGQGITAAVLEREGLKLFDEKQLEACTAWLQKVYGTAE